MFENNENSYKTEKRKENSNVNISIVFLSVL